jgi:3-oxoacyl-[acyl-carrier protein] reductase
MDLSGKSAIITGGGRDIGAACALRLARAGADVAVNFYSSDEGAKKVVCEIEAAGGRAIALRGDMTDPADAAALVDAAVKAFGKVEIVVSNCGGILARKPLSEITLEHWNAVMAINVTSALLIAQAAVPQMPTGGAIVNVASQAGRDGGGPGALAYAAAKGAVMTMTRGMAKELAPGIRVNAICPGMIDTDFHNIFTKPEVRAAVAGSTPLKREGRPEDVGNLVAYLASDEAAFVTGACVDINGGMLFS